MFVLDEGLHKILDITTVVAQATYVSKNDTEKSTVSTLWGYQNNSVEQRPSSVESSSSSHAILRIWWNPKVPYIVRVNRSRRPYT